MIFCFSGTGNSRYVADGLASLLGQEVVPMNSDTIAVSPSFSMADGPTVWVFPIHSWGVPDFVVRFIKAAGVAMTAPGCHYMVCTCGDDIGLAHRQWRRMMSDRGWKAMAAFSVQMPNTYVVLPGFDVDSPSIAEGKIAASAPRIRQIAGAIVAGSCTDDVVEGGMPWIKSRVVYPYFMKHMISPKPFRVMADRCIGCGRCMAACPLHNVALDSESHPVWGSDCTLCLGCYHVCPRHVVQYGNRTLHKGQYYCVMRPGF